MPGRERGKNEEKVHQNSVKNKTQTQSVKENRVKESNKPAQIMEIIGREEENMKQVVGTTNQKEPPTIQMNMKL